MKTICALLFLSLHFFSFNQDITKTFTVYFKHDNAQISSESKIEMDSLFHLNDQIKIERILAFCDPTGSEIYNNDLAKRRLSSVTKILSVHTEELGEQIVLGENYTNKQEAIKKHHLLRRVEIHYSISTIEKTKEIAKLSSFDEIDLSPTSLASAAPFVLKIQFFPGLPILLNSSYQEIENLFSFLSKNEKLHATIRGHVCCDNDFPLSMQRAKEVYSILIEKGISSRRLNYDGFSNTLPFVSPEITEEDRQQNRRVDVIFTIQE